MVDYICFEISGLCNAKCAWCISGKKNRNKVASGKFINIEDFKRAIYHLVKEGVIDKKKTWVALYNWGDPMLHPKIKEILRFLNQEQIITGISTNGSKKIIFGEEDRGILSNVRHIGFSMPGFSQHSYDKNHGFDFETVKDNITEMTKNFYEVGELAANHVFNIFHMYQYNLLEIPAAAQFAAKNKASFWPYTAYINDPELNTQYCKSELPYELLKKASQELFLLNYTNLDQNPTNDCAQYHSVTIDENCQAVLCCGPDVKLGSIFDMTEAKYHRLQQASSTCVECKRLGINKLEVVQMQDLLPIGGQI